jgi:mannose-6-phosphate isomerase-like protein (cupin superfamily)
MSGLRLYIGPMSTPRPVVVHHPDGGLAGQPTPDAERLQQWEREGRWAAWIRNDAGDVSGWHHHAANDTYVYVSRGSLTIDFGPGGVESVEARPGDLVVVPPHTVHRETTGPDADLEAFVIRIGGEPEHVRLDGPDGG